MTKNFQIENGILKIFEGTAALETEQFSENSDIVTVILPEGLECISAASFLSCENLKKINIPSTVRIIDEGAFLSCGNLEEIVLPNGLESIEALSFQCTGLHQITVPDTVKLIGDEAFFDCQNLTEANVLGKNTEICADAFGSNYKLIKGYIAPGYPPTAEPGSELLYSLLWASCPHMHDEATSTRAENFIKQNEMLVMERIIKFNNTAAMTGISEYKLLERENIDDYVKTANDEGLTELTALLIKCKGNERSLEDEFEL